MIKLISISIQTLFMKRSILWLKDFYFHTDISYTAPGMVDVMTIWGDDGKKNFVNTI